LIRVFLLSVLYNIIKRTSGNDISAKLLLDQIGEQKSIKRPKPDSRFHGSDGFFINDFKKIKLHSTVIGV